MYGCLSQVSCVGQVIGAIAAETQAQAQRAAKMVKVTYKDLPRILTIEVGANFNIARKFCYILVLHPLNRTADHFRLIHSKTT